MEQALSDVQQLLSTLLAKEYSSDNLETIFKVSLCACYLTTTRVYFCVCVV